MTSHHLFLFQTESTSPNNEETSQSGGEMVSNVPEYGPVYNVMYPNFFYNGGCPQTGEYSQKTRSHVGSIVFRSLALFRRPPNRFCKSVTTCYICVLTHCQIFRFLNALRWAKDILDRWMPLNNDVFIST